MTFHAALPRSALQANQHGSLTNDQQYELLKVEEEGELTLPSRFPSLA